MTRESNKITVSWSLVNWYRATIDLDDPAYEGLTPGDFACGNDPSERVAEALAALEDDGGRLYQSDGLEVSLENGSDDQ
jgi:hypothetical protein